MKSFIHDDFLLQTGTARELYHRFAEPQPIFDYHCHVPPDQIAENKVFRNLYEIWLAGDHYKWRAMRTNGVAERFCTGDASDWEKFLAWARTVPHTLRNPLHHWTHLELKRYFGIDELLDEDSAQRIWDRANEQLASMPAQEIIRRSRVNVICTTDDPTDSLEHHRKIRAQQEAAGGSQGSGVRGQESAIGGQGSGFTTRVYPTFRPDKALAVDQPAFNAWVDKLAAASGIDCDTFANFLAALKQRHDFFHEMGGRLSDHGLPHCHADDCTEAEAAGIFAAARVGRAPAKAHADKFRSFLMLYFGELDAARGWTKQLHLGPLRNNNTRLARAVGADIGCDSIGDWPQAEALSRYLDRLDQRERLPRTILYNVNPCDNYTLGTMIGNFQDGSIAGKIQFGSGWWFLDQKEGMEWQINALSALGLLSRFVGMLTDSRSFLSYTRHEYFRRILCNLLGRDAENGELPRDIETLGALVKNICYDNARNFFGLETGEA
jgi:glucuronate isomerase